MAYSNWSFNSNNNSFTGVSAFTPTLPAGMYNLRQDNWGTPMAFKVGLKADEFCSFQHGPLQEVLTEANKFWDSEKHYHALGVSHKRGILLHGKPGCGKSGIISELIRICIQREGLVFSLNDPHTFTSALPKLRQIEKKRPMLGVMEDIDALCEDYEEELLETLDGNSNISDGVLFVATTNYMDKVPARIRCRPSRVDTLIEIGLPNELQRYEYLCFICKGGFKQDVSTLAAWAKATHGMSLAGLKEVVISVAIYGKTIDETVDRIKQLEEAE